MNKERFSDAVLINDFLNSAGFHLTFSEKHLLLRFIPEICLKKGVCFKDFIKQDGIANLIGSKMNPVQKGKNFFRLIRAIRYPLSGGKNENLKAGRPDSGVKNLNSRERLVNPYFYGEGIFDLKEHVVSLIHGCPMECAYCFIKEIYKRSNLKVTPDYKKIRKELERLRKRERGVICLNAGENADSMILDAEFNLCKELWSVVKPLKNVFLEFRTKTDKIQGLLKIRGHPGRIIASFSLNPEEDRKTFENNSAPIAHRVDSILKLQEAGFAVGLRFEPVIYTKNYQEKYQTLMDNIFSKVSPGRIHSIAFGCLRMTKGLKKLLQKSHPEICAEEWVLGPDGKFRYCREMRIEIYENLLKIIEPYFPFHERIVLSTEPAAVWNAVGLPLKTMPEICALC